MPDAWDTSVASRVHGRSRHARLLAAHRQNEIPIALPAPVVQEIVRGLTKLRHEHDRSIARWFGRLFRDELTEVICFDRRAAELAGRLLSLHPHPPTRNHRRHGTRSQQRAAWVLDVQIAACAFARGYGVLTENIDDFAMLRDAIAKLLPNVRPLVVSDAPV